MSSLRPALLLLLALASAPAHAIVLESTPDYPNAITPRGPKGDIGCSVIPTNSAPAANIGRDCDWAFDAAAGKVYGPKLAGQWGPGVVMSPVIAAQTFADRARFDREQARASALAAADSATGAAAAEAAATAVQSWFNGLAPNEVLSAAHGGAGTASPDRFGAAGDGTTDDRTPFLSAAASLGDTGGVIQLTCAKKYYLSNLQLPHNVTLRACLTNPDNPGGINQSQDYSVLAGIRLSGATATTTMTTTKGSNVVVVSSATGIVKGMSLTARNVPGGSFVTDVSGLNVTMSEPATASTGATVTDCQLSTGTGSTFANAVGCDPTTAGIAVGAVLTSPAFPAGTTVTGIGFGFIEFSVAATATDPTASASFVNPASDTATFFNTITLGAAAGVEKVLIYRAGMTFPAPNAGSYAGTALRCGYNADGCFVRDALVIGFNKGFVSKGVSRYTYANGRVLLENFRVDAQTGVEISGSFDRNRIVNVHCWPFGTVGAGGGNPHVFNYRTGSCIKLAGNNDGAFLDDILDHGHAVSIDLDRTSEVRFGSLFIENYTANAGTIGVRTSKNVTAVSFGTIHCYNHETCFVRDGNAGEEIRIGSFMARNTGHEAIRLDGGDLTIGMADISGPGQTLASAPLVLNSASSVLQIRSGHVTNPTASFVIKNNAGATTDRVSVDLRADIADGGYLADANPILAPTFASANTVLLPFNGDVFYVSGTTDVYTFAGGNTDGKVLTLHVVDGLTFRQGGNLVIPGGDRVAPANSFVRFGWSWRLAKWVMVDDGSETSTPPTLYASDIKVQDARILAASNTSALKGVSIAPLPAGTRALRLGVATAGDGGAAEYTLSLSSCSAPDDATQVAPNAGTGCWIVDAPFGGLSAKVFGAKGDGVTNDTAALQAALNAAGSNKIEFPCGTFVFASTLKIPSNATVEGRGECTILKLSSAMSGAASNYKAVLSAAIVPSFGGAAIENADYVNGNHGISLREMQIDGSALLPAAIHVIAFYKVNGATLRGLHIKGRNAADSNTYTGIALIASYDNIVQGNRTEALVTGIGTWDEPHDELIDGNIIIGGDYSKQQNGIVVNAISTDYVAKTGYNIQVTNNTIRHFPAANATAIDFTGLCYSQDNLGCASGAGPFVYGLLTNSIVGANTIKNHGGVGIRVGEGSNLTISTNIIEGTGSFAIAVRSGRDGPTDGVLIESNQVINANMNAVANIDAISVGNNSADAPTGVVLKGNIVRGSNHRYAIRINAGVVGAQISGGSYAAGTSGVYSNSGTSTYADLKGSWTPQVRFGGGSTGVAYAPSSQIGSYWVNGKIAYVCGEFTLSSKGSSTGAASVLLPFTSDAVEQAIPIAKQQNLSGVTWPAPYAVVTASQSQIKLFTNNSQSTNITEANFTDTTAMKFCGTVALP